MSDCSPIKGLEALVTKCVNIAMEVSFTRSELNNGALEIRRSKEAYEATVDIRDHISRQQVYEENWSAVVQMLR